MFLSEVLSSTLHSVSNHLSDACLVQDKHNGRYNTNHIVCRILSLISLLPILILLCHAKIEPYKPLSSRLLFEPQHQQEMLA